MCGIAGLFRFRDRSRSIAEADRRRVEAMVHALDHRGPDGHGVAEIPAGERAGCVLGHTRLSILDLSELGTQPMHGERVCLTYNGELYNFAPLRDRVIARGAAVRSTGDTEVLLHALELDWSGALADIDGMFAFAAFDMKRRELLLARDRVGKKPLFFARENGAIVFASELAALRAGGIELALDEDALPEFLVRGYVQPPRTLCRGVEQLEAGELAIIDADGRMRRERYWQTPWLRETPPIAIETDVDTAARRVRELFERAVERRLAADVPLGAFLSGGVDSSAVVAVAQRFVRRKLQTFTIGYEGAPEWDETAGARETARFIGTEHTEEILRPEGLDLLPRLIAASGEPQGDSSLVPTYLVSRLARRSVTVALTGDGGDELFAGYDRFLLALAGASIPQRAGTAASRLFAGVPEGPRALRPLRRLKRWARAVSLGPAATLMEWSGGTRVSDVEALLGRSLDSARLARPEHDAIQSARSHGAPRLQALLAANLVTYLPGNTLIKVDRASMANSLEARSPFLDTALLEYAASLSPWLIARGLSLKWILKRALSTIVPPMVMKRKKRGFGAPVANWFRGDTGRAARDRLLDRRAAIAGMFDSKVLGQVFDAHAAAREDSGILLWRLLALDEWLTWAASSRAEPRGAQADSIENSSGPK